MKVLMINKFLYPNGGSETYMLNLGKYLEETGNEVQYFGMDHEKRCVGNNAGAYTSNMDFHCGSKFSKLSYPIKTIYSIEARKQIRKVLDDFKPDVCHLNNFNYQLTPSIILEIVDWRKSEQCNCKIIYTAHDYQLVCPNHMLHNPNAHENCEKCMGGNFGNCIKNKCIHGSTVRSVIGSVEAYYWKLRNVYRYIDVIICPSMFVKQKLDTDVLLKEKTVVLHNFVEDKHSDLIDDSVMKSLPKKYVLYFGRLSKEKGADIIFEVSRQLPNVNFVVAGTGPLEPDVPKCDNLTYLGFCKGSKLNTVIRRASFSICPSICYEVYGLSNAESILCGTPVIAFNSGGVSEVITDNYNGLLMEVCTVKQLKENILMLWNSEERLGVLKKNCANCKYVSVEEYAESMMRYYN